MSGPIFESPQKLKSAYSEVAFGALASASDASTAVTVHRFDVATHVSFIDNGTDAEVVVLLQNEKKAGDADGRLLWFKLGPERVINFNDNSIGGRYIPAGTLLMIYCEGGAPTLGKFRIAAW